MWEQLLLCFLQLFRISFLFSFTGSLMLISALTSKGSLWRHPHRNNSGRRCLWRGRLWAACLQLLSSFIWLNFISDFSKWIAVLWSRDIPVYLWRLWQQKYFDKRCLQDLCTWCACVLLFFALACVLLGTMQMNTSSTCSSKIVLQAKASAA